MSERYAIGVDGPRTVVVSVGDGAIVHSPDWSRVIAIGVTNGDPPRDAPPTVPVISVRREAAIVAGCDVAAPSTLVMVLDDPATFVINSRTDVHVGGGVERIPEGFLPEYIGYRFQRPTPDPADQSTIEAAAFDIRDVIECIREAGVQVRRFMACGALSKDERVLQTYANVLDGRIKLPSSDAPAALGAAILAALSTGSETTGHASMSLLVHAMASQRKDLMYRPDLRARRAYDRMFRERHRSR